MSKRYVLKIGSSLLTNEDGALNRDYLEFLVKHISDALKKGTELLIVTSGAIATGIGRLGMHFEPKSLPEKQALAAVGQVVLMNEYKTIFNKYDHIIAQILLTRNDISNREGYINTRNTLLTLLNKNIIPIINENDTVSTEEIKFGDNDMLSALVASKVEADYLVILSDVEGLYTDNPKKNKDAQLVKEVEKIDDKIIDYAGTKGSMRGTGGMITKLNAAKLATGNGVEVIIANGSNKEILSKIFSDDNIGTKFLADKHTRSSKQKWLASCAHLKGEVWIDDGAKDAMLNKGKSLLPVGIKKVTGNFEIGDAVCILDSDGKKIAQGIVLYSSKEIQMIQGKSSGQIEEILGHKDYDEVVHRDNMVVLT
ncbi:glutamate 5-kinase [bacterium]